MLDYASEESSDKRSNNKGCRISVISHTTRFTGRMGAFSLSASEVRRIRAWWRRSPQSCCSPPRCLWVLDGFMSTWTPPGASVPPVKGGSVQALVVSVSCFWRPKQYLENQWTRFQRLSPNMCRFPNRFWMQFHCEYVNPCEPKDEKKLVGQ